MAKNPLTGLSPVRARMHKLAIELCNVEDLVQASYSYNIVPLDKPAGDILYAGGEMFHAAKLLPETGELTAVGCGAATLGSRIENRISELFANRNISLALAVHEVAVQLLFALGRRIQDRMLSETIKKRLTMAGELCAGDPGLDLDTQAVMLRLSGADAIGITVNKGMLMHPMKSTTMLFGIGNNLPPVRWSRCDTCPSNGKCNFARPPLKTPVAGSPDHG